MPEITWSDVKSSPVRELFKGIRLRPLWKGENGASAQVLEIDPGCCWEGSLKETYAVDFGVIANK